MSDETTRRTLSSAIQETLHDDETAQEAEVDGSLLVGWVVVAEWATPDDGFAITVRTGGHGEQPIPWWRAKGLMAYANDEMFVPGGDDDEEEED